jgi:hypothetical protein
MGTAYVPIKPNAAAFLATTFPQLDKVNGTNIPVPILKYDAAADEAAFWRFVATGYSTGNLTLDIWWYADTATANDVVWGGAIAAITANTDSQDIETDALATENTVTDTHLGTTGQRLHLCTITISNLDSIAADDEVVLRIRRVGANGSDTMTGDACLVQARLSYTTA